MKLRVFLDTNVFIYAFEFSDSNSHKIVEMLNEEKIEAVISERVVKEILRYFKKFYDRRLANHFRNYILQSCLLVLRHDVTDEMKRWHGTIKEKDLEQIAVAKSLGLKYLVSLDRDFKEFEEYVTPREFSELPNG